MKTLLEICLIERQARREEISAPALRARPASMHGFNRTEKVAKWSTLRPSETSQRQAMKEQ
jgi:hypothetical protein